MKNVKISLALAALAGIASAQNAETSVAQVKEQVEAIDGKLTGLEENYLETKATVAGLAKLKIGGLVQARMLYYTDTNLVSGAHPSTQGTMLVRRGRLKATYTAGNGSEWVMQYDIKPSGLTPQDIYVKWSEPYLKLFSIQMGLQDMPFGYEISYSSGTMEMLERSSFERSAMFKDEKDMGVILGITPSIPGLDEVSLKGAFLNGYGTKTVVEDPANFVGRLNIKKNLPDVGVGFGLGGSFFTDTRKVRSSGAFYYEVDGSTSPQKTGAANKELNATVFGVDAQVTVDMSMVPFLAGAKIMGELYTGNSIGTKANLERTVLTADTLYNRDVMGWYVTFVQNIGTALQAVVRYDVYDPNTNVSDNEVGASGTATSKTDLAYANWYFGLNYFLNGNTKVTLGYDLIANETSSRLASSKKGGSNLSQEVKDDVVTAQLQFAF